MWLDTTMYDLVRVKHKNLCATFFFVFFFFFTPETTKLEAMALNAENSQYSLEILMLKSAEQLFLLKQSLQLQTSLYLLTKQK